MSDDHQRGLRQQLPEPVDELCWGKGWTRWAAYQAHHQNGNVPKDYRDKDLYKWVQRQRVDYWKWKRGEASYLCEDGFQMMTRCGFDWGPDPSPKTDADLPKLGKSQEEEEEEASCNDSSNNNNKASSPFREENLSSSCASATATAMAAMQEEKHGKEAVVAVEAITVKKEDKQVGKKKKVDGALAKKNQRLCKTKKKSARNMAVDEEEEGTKEEADTTTARRVSGIPVAATNKETAYICEEGAAAEAGEKNQKSRTGLKKLDDDKTEDNKTAGGEEGSEKARRRRRRIANEDITGEGETQTQRMTVNGGAEEEIESWGLRRSKRTRKQTVVYNVGGSEAAAAEREEEDDDEVDESSSTEDDESTEEEEVESATGGLRRSKRTRKATIVYNVGGSAEGAAADEDDDDDDDDDDDESKGPLRRRTKRTRKTIVDLGNKQESVARHNNTANTSSTSARREAHKGEASTMTAVSAMMKGDGEVPEELPSGSGGGGGGGSCCGSSSGGGAPVVVVSSAIAATEGFITTQRELNEERWEAHYQKLIKFKEKFGHARIPRNYVPDQNFATWAMRQRQMWRKRKEGKPHTLSPYRIQKLQDVEFVFNTMEQQQHSDDDDEEYESWEESRRRPGNLARSVTMLKRNEGRWDAHFQKLVEFKERFGHTRVPRRYKPDMDLASWASRQRQMWNKLNAGKPHTLTAERLQRLADVDFVFKADTTLDRSLRVPQGDAAAQAKRQAMGNLARSNTMIKHNDELWEANFRKLVRFKEHYGHTRVPRRYKPDQNFAFWAGRQRQMWRKMQADQPHTLTPYRIQRLEGLDFAFQADPTQKPVKTDSPAVLAQRKAMGNLARKEAMIKLNDARWEGHFQKLVKFKERFGHTRVPRRYKADQNLASWASKQRQMWNRLMAGKPNTMAPHRLERLKSVDFVFKAEPMKFRGEESVNKLLSLETEKNNLSTTFPVSPSSPSVPSAASSAAAGSHQEEETTRGDDDGDELDQGNNCGLDNNELDDREDSGLDDASAGAKPCNDTSMHSEPQSEKQLSLVEKKPKPTFDAFKSKNNALTTGESGEYRRQGEKTKNDSTTVGRLGAVMVVVVVGTEA